MASVPHQFATTDGSLPRGHRAIVFGERNAHGAMEELPLSPGNKCATRLFSVGIGGADAVVCSEQALARKIANFRRIPTEIPE
jgi:hypothetical protein